MLVKGFRGETITFRIISNHERSNPDEGAIGIWNLDSIATADRVIAPTPRRRSGHDGQTKRNGTVAAATVLPPVTTPIPLRPHPIAPTRRREERGPAREGRGTRKEDRRLARCDRGQANGTGVVDNRLPCRPVRFSLSRGVLAPFRVPLTRRPEQREATGEASFGQGQEPV